MLYLNKKKGEEEEKGNAVHERPVLNDNGHLGGSEGLSFESYQETKVLFKEQN